MAAGGPDGPALDRYPRRVTTAPIRRAEQLQPELEAHRRELTAYCYRMLGSGAEAEDAAQEALVRAWRSAEGFEGRASLRTWLYRIATNVCIDMGRSPQRRALPMDLSAPVPQRGAEPGPMTHESQWVLPQASGRLIDLDGDPGEVAARRESVRLALVAALQHLPARQRAVLILREVLGWSAAEVAELLESSVASVNSALQRARATLAERPDARRLDPLDDPRHRELLERYVDAFERYDMDALVTLLHHEVVLSMPPFAIWLQGADDLLAWFVGQGIGCQGSRLLPLELNGTAGFASYKPAPSGRLEPWAIQVIDVADGAIVGHHNFIFPELFAQLGLPRHLDATP